MVFCFLLSDFYLEQSLIVLQHFFPCFKIRNDSDGEGESEDPEKKKLQNQLQGNFKASFFLNRSDFSQANSCIFAT